MAKKNRLDGIPVAPPEDSYFFFQVPSQAIFERGAGWTAPAIEVRRENEILPGKHVQWWKPSVKMKGDKATIQLTDTTRRDRPWFASYWDSVISKGGRFDDMIWLYEIQARLDGHFAFGKPASHLSQIGLIKLFEVARNTGIAHEGWQRPGSEPLLSRTYGGTGWTECMFFPVKMEAHGPHVTKFSLNLSQGSESMLLAELRKSGFSGSVRKFRSWLKTQREKHKQPGPSRYASKGQPRRAKPWLFIEALDDRAAGFTPSRVDMQRGFDWYRCRLGRWMQKDFLPFPYECDDLDFEDEFKSAVNCSETQKFELTRGDWMVEEDTKYITETRRRRTH